MTRKFHAYGVLYNLGDTIGLTDKTLSDDVMRKIVVNSPFKVPVLSELGKGISYDPDYVIGSGTIIYQPGTDIIDSRLVCRVEFNERHRKEYEVLFNSGKTRKPLKFGFLLSRIMEQDENGKSRICNGRITAISLNETGLGGGIISYGWDTVDNPLAERAAITRDLEGELDV